MKSNPVVSVIIPAYNSEGHIETSINSVLGQTYTDFELIIVDDGSKDNTLELARKITDHAKERCSVIQHPNGTNRGVAESRNLAAKQATGTYLAFLDADDLWLPEKLANQVSHMEAHPDAGLSWTRARILREGEGEAFMPGIDILGDAPDDHPKLAVLKIIQVATNYIFSTVMVRTDAFRNVGGFPEALPYQSEDRLMVAKVATHHRVTYVDEILCTYLAHDASYSSGVVRNRLVPVIFYDMQARFVLWLGGPGQRLDWSRDMAMALLPPYYFPALCCKWSKSIRKGVLDKTREVFELFPDMKVRFYYYALWHTRPGLFILRLWRGKPDPLLEKEDPSQRP